ncbi:hypothetical protein TIFTF001_047289 [Ficus carica]|uniref:Uncharacterized protein n=1 Tax=Ficus carica TaxID=3494 RepID=A0AA87YTB8_FICCA|nr:hypothetical protein TIFTF001_047289 [Ficus carica]
MAFAAEISYADANRALEVDHDTSMEAMVAMFVQ